jgi:hypothetical protein
MDLQTLNLKSIQQSFSRSLQSISTQKNPTPLIQPKGLLLLSQQHTRLKPVHTNIYATIIQKKYNTVLQYACGTSIN